MRSPTEIRNELRAFLNSPEANLREIARSTPLTVSWLSKFRRGELDNPTVQQLQEVWDYRESLGAGSLGGGLKGIQHQGAVS